MNQCTRPPEGWVCTRDADHEGSCAAIPDPAVAEQSEPTIVNNHVVMAEPKEPKLPRTAGGRETIRRIVGFIVGVAVFVLLCWAASDSDAKADRDTAWGILLFSVIVGMIAAWTLKAWVRSAYDYHDELEARWKR